MPAADLVMLGVNEREYQHCLKVFGPYPDKESRKTSYYIHQKVGEKNQTANSNNNDRGKSSRFISTSDPGTVSQSNSNTSYSTWLTASKSSNLRPSPVSVTRPILLHVSNRIRSIALSIHLRVLELLRIRIVQKTIIHVVDMAILHPLFRRVKQMTQRAFVDAVNIFRSNHSSETII